jgi:NADH-quinone oxidoreductase subunit M
MIAHGISTGALFFLVGMLYERRHTRLIADFGGVARAAPLLATAFRDHRAFASIGLPGLNGLRGRISGVARQLRRASPWPTLIATTVVIFRCGVPPVAVQRVFFNPSPTPPTPAFRI